MTDNSLLVRPNIQKMIAYSSARSEYAGNGHIWLDANESPYGEYNRYPDTLPVALIDKIAEIKNVKSKNVFVGNGSDEAIDLLIRAYCEPKQDTILCFTPGYSMYQVSAAIQDIKRIEIPLDDYTSIPLQKVQQCYDCNEIKITFLCSPNNPTGNLLSENEIEWVLKNANGLVVIDEAYIDFSSRESYANLIESFSNLIVLHTLSKAYGMAALRIGSAIANPDIITILNKIKPPYNTNSLSQRIAFDKLQGGDYKYSIASIKEEREIVSNELQGIKEIRRIFKSDSNFILFQAKDAQTLYEYLLKQGIIIRNKSKSIKDGLRISIGSSVENQFLIQQIKSFYQS